MVRSRWALGLVLVLAAGPVPANPPVASYIFPAGGQRGKTVAVRVGGLFLYDKCGFELLGPGVDGGKELRRTHTLWLKGPILALPDSQRQEDYPQDMTGQVNMRLPGQNPPAKSTWMSVHAASLDGEWKSRGIFLDRTWRAVHDRPTSSG